MNYIFTLNFYCVSISHPKYYKYTELIDYIHLSAVTIIRHLKAVRIIFVFFCQQIWRSKPFIKVAIDIKSCTTLKHTHNSKQEYDKINHNIKIVINVCTIGIYKYNHNVIWRECYNRVCERNETIQGIACHSVVSWKCNQVIKSTQSMQSNVQCWRMKGNTFDKSWHWLFSFDKYEWSLTKRFDFSS